jgi:hypothetical protein
VLVAGQARARELTLVTHNTVRTSDDDPRIARHALQKVHVHAGAIKIRSFDGALRQYTDELGNRLGRLNGRRNRVVTSTRGQELVVNLIPKEEDRRRR